MPDWLTPGTTVAVIANHNEPSARVLRRDTIERVLQRDVVLTSKERWTKTGLAHDGRYIQARSMDAWHTPHRLYPASDPDVARTDAKSKDRNRISRIQRLLEDAAKAARDNNLDQVAELISKVSVELAEAPTTPTS